MASSDKADGTSAVLPYTEDMPLHGRAPYEVSKACTDLVAQSYAVTYGLPVTIARWRDETALIASGVKDGEIVATAGVHKLEPGQKVKPLLQAAGQ